MTPQDCVLWGEAPRPPGRHWNTVTADGELPDRLVRELVEDSYDLVVAGLPRADRLRLDRA